MDVDREKALAAAVGAAVAKERVRVGMTQEDLAEALNIGPEAVSRFERGIIMPSLSRLVELAEIFGCSVEKFLTSGSEIVGDQTALIETLIGPLRKADRQFVVDLIERTCAHLTARR